MVRLLLTGAVGLCLLPTAFSQGTSAKERGVLKGNVGDTANGPISKAFVLVHRSGADDLNAHPDERGDFDQTGTGTSSFRQGRLSVDSA